MINKTKVILLTGHFPYYPGEQFLEEEINCWSKFFKGTVVIVPSNSFGVCRATPRNVKVKRLDKTEKAITKVLLVVRTLFSTLFIKEVFYLVFHRKEFKFSLLKSVFLISYRVLLTAFRYEKIIKAELKCEVVVYSYWNNVESYAMAYLRQRQKKYRFPLISRAHGFDVYEELRPFGYMPLKRQFKDKFDRILAISEAGKSYLQTRYLFQNVTVERLGVNIGDTMCKPGDDNEIVIISLSHCTPIKRIDRIIKGIYTCALANPNIYIHWHHLGGGDEFDELKKLSRELLDLQNINWIFHGELTNTEVHHFIQITKIDVLVNASASEGVPVSIMEAMSYGIPAIAPDIGGVKELILPETGILMSVSPDEQEIAAALERKEFYKNGTVRQAARNHITERFNSEKNYKRLISMAENYSHSMR